MEFKELVETHISIINIIVKSTDEIIPIIYSNPELDEQLKDTIVQVFKFIEKIISTLPDLLITANNTLNQKEIMSFSLSRIIDEIDELPAVPDKLNSLWNEFSLQWKDYSSKLNFISKSENTIFLSMN